VIDDPAVRQTALESETKAEDRGGATLSEDPGEPATIVVARVGDTVITTTEFAYGVRDRVRGASYAQLTPEQKAQVQKETLEYLIDRAMLVQEARKRLKDPKQWEVFKSSVEKEWIDRELPAMIAHAKVRDEFELEKALEKGHQSLAEIRENYMLDHIGGYFMRGMIQDKFLPPSLDDLYRFYEKNRDRPEFQQTAQVTWRLIFVPVDDTIDRATAKLAAGSALGRLQRGEEFVAVCKQVSRGPRAQEGGLWSTGYESYNSEKVNEALKALPLNRVSPVIEDDRGFYIVRVEGRREAGPKPFAEVQKSISDALIEERYHVAMEDFLQDLRRRVPVACRPEIEGTPLEPKQMHPERLAKPKSGAPTLTAGE
jgi:parvulin-like peptidyl-prolyl isomerase